MNKKYDLIMVGAGPAGLMAAKTAAENNLTVALVDKRRNFPVDQGRLHDVLRPGRWFFRRGY